MVQVEVPLWIIHSSSLSPATTNTTTSKSSKEEIKQNNNDNNKEKNNYNLLKLLSGTSSRSPIYTLDICKDYISTGGGDGCIKIWNANDLFNNKSSSNKYSVNGYESGNTTSSSCCNKVNDKDDKNKNTVISDEQYQPMNILKSHTGSILTLRFSPSGKYLASGGDDHLVLIYTLKDNRMTNKKEWVRSHTCRGHNLDVMGISWSPDEEYVVSCSLDKDSPIIIWKFNNNASTSTTTTTHLLHPYRILGKEIQFNVKGISFDPIGTFVIGYGESGSICFYRCSDDWKLERIIKKKEPTSSTTLLKRIDCSPDGEWVCCTNVLLSGKHVASMVKIRVPNNNNSNTDNIPQTNHNDDNNDDNDNDNDNGANLVGHKDAIVCARYCPAFIQKKNDNITKTNTNTKQQATEYGMLIAIGDTRGFLTIWSTSSSKPLFKLQVSESRCTITDICWSYNDHVLVSLLDGHVVLLSFDQCDKTDGGIGTLLLNDQTHSIFKNKYGIEDGKVRVGSDAPMLMETVYFNNYDNDNNANTNHQDISNGANINNHYNNPSSQLQPQPQPKLQRKHQLPSSSTTTTTTLSGKKRIRPVLIGQDNNTNHNYNNSTSITTQMPLTTTTLQTKTTTFQHSASTKQSHSTMAPQQPSSSSSATTPTKRVMQDMSNATSTATKLPSYTHLKPAFSSSSSDTTNNNTNTLSIDLPIKQQSQEQQYQPSSSVPPTSIIATITNNKQSMQHPSSTLHVSQSGKIYHTETLPHTLSTTLAASYKYLVIGTKQGSIIIYSTASCKNWNSLHCYKVSPSFVVSSEVLYLHISLNDDIMLTIALDGMFYVHDLNLLQLLYKGTIVPPRNYILASANLSSSSKSSSYSIRIVRAYFTSSSEDKKDDDKKLILILSISYAMKGKRYIHFHAYAYHKQMELWNIIQDSRYDMHHSYNKIRYDDNASSNKKITILSNLEQLFFQQSNSNNNNAQQQPPQPYYNLLSPELQITYTKSYLQDRIATSIILNSSSDLLYYLSLYMQKLALLGEEERIRFIVNVRLEEIDDDESGTSSNNDTFLNKKDFMKMVLKEISKNVNLGRLVAEFSNEMDRLF